MRFLPDAIERLDHQYGLVTRPQLLADGHTAKQVDAMLRRGHLERFHHGTYRRTGSANSPQQDAMAAVLRCRPRARVTGPMLLGLLGVEGFAPNASFTILVPCGRRVQNVPFPVRVDRAPGRDRARYGDLPGTTPLLTLFEYAIDVHDDQEVLSAYDRMRWRGVLDRHRLAAGLRAHPRHPGAKRIGALVEGGACGPESPGERNLQQVLAGFAPQPEWQVWVAPAIRVDALWRDCALALEYLGQGTHEDPRDRAADAGRDGDLVALGITVLYVTREDLSHSQALLNRITAVRKRLLASRV